MRKTENLDEELRKMKEQLKFVEKFKNTYTEQIKCFNTVQEDFAKMMDELEFEENRQMLAEISQQLYKSILEFGIAEARLDNDCKTMKQMIANLQLGNI